MGTLSFLDDPPFFDGDCVRFVGVDGKVNVLCGVTTAALKYCDSSLPHYGLLPAEAFMAAYEKLKADIRHVARSKYEAGKFEPQGPVRIMVHHEDIAP